MRIVFKCCVNRLLSCGSPRARGVSDNAKIRKSMQQGDNNVTDCCTTFTDSARLSAPASSCFSFMPFCSTGKYLPQSTRVLCGKYSSALRRVRWRSPHTRSRLSVFFLFSQGHVGGGWPACAFMASCILFCINMRFDWLRVCAYFHLAYMLLCKFLNKNKEISAYYAARNA